MKKKTASSEHCFKVLSSCQRLLQQFACLFCWWAGGRTCWRPHDSTSKHQHFCSVSHLCFFFFFVPCCRCRLTPSPRAGCKHQFLLSSGDPGKVTRRRRPLSLALYAQRGVLPSVSTNFYTPRFKRSTSCLAPVGV